MPSPPRRRRLPAAALTAAAALVVACNGAVAEGAPAPRAAEAEAFVTFLPDGPRVKVELAVTPGDRMRGLMHREHLAEGHGMLFVFEEEALHTFWMRNTLIPLDMIFIDEDRTVVGMVHEAAPLTDAPREIDVPSRYVLEVPGGWARARGIRTGDRVRLEGLP